MEQIEQQKKNLNFFVNPFFGEILPVSLSEGPIFGWHFNTRIKAIVKEKGYGSKSHFKIH